MSKPSYLLNPLNDDALRLLSRSTQSHSSSTPANLDPNLHLLYRDHLARIYGGACAQASVVEKHPDGYLINVAVLGPQGYELRGTPLLHSVARLFRMCQVLSQRGSLTEAPRDE